MKATMAAYFAGALDSDGTFMLIGRPDGIRVEPWVALNQVTPRVPYLLQEYFGGNIHYAPLSPPRRPRYMWRATGNLAIAVCNVVRPYLQIKGRQADILLELNAMNTEPQFRSYAYWYALEHPDWERETLLTFPEVQKALNYSHPDSVRLAVKTNVLLALPGRPGRLEGRVPKGLVGWLADLKRATKNKVPQVPPQLLAKRRELFTEIRIRNKRGVDVAPEHS